MKLNSNHLTGANQAYFELFDSAIYDGFCYCEKSKQDDFEFNEKLKRLLGYEAKYAIELSEIFQPEDLNPFLKLLSDANSSGEIAQNEEFGIISKSGEILLMTLQIYSKIKDENSNHFIFIGFKCIAEGAFSNRKALLRQKRNEEILDGTAIGAWQYNLISEELIWNESLSKIIGYKIEEFKISDYNFWQKLIDREDLNKSQEILEEHFRKKSSYFTHETRIRHQDENWIWIVIVGKVLNYYESNQPQWMGGIVYDITDKKKSELLTVKYEDLLNRVNEAAKIGIWEVDLATLEMSCSDEIKKMFGIPLNVNPTLDDAINLIKQGKNRQKLVDSVQNAIENGLNYDIELEAVDLEEKLILVRAIGLSEFNNGKCTRFYGFIQNINQKANTIRELALKEELFRKTFINAPSGMALVNLDAKISLLNKNLCDFLGYSEEELLHSYLRKFSYPPDKYLTTIFINQLLAGSDETLKIDKRYVHKNGSIIWAQVSMSTIKDEFGHIINFVVQLQDINERKNAEFSLTNYKDLLERSNRIAKIGTREINVEDYTVIWSKSLNIVVNTREDLIPTYDDSIKHLINEVHHELIDSAIKNSLEFGENFDVQLLAKTADNSKWIRIIGIAEFENFKVVRLYGLIQDINGIKKAQKELESKEEQWRTTFDHSSAGIALINFDGVAYKVNESLCDIFGYTVEEIQHIRIKNISIPEDLDQNIEMMRNLINGSCNSFRIERQFIHKNGSIIWTDLTVSAVKNDFNKLTHMVAQIIDITESKTNVLLLKKYKEILERSNDLAKIGSWELNPKNNDLFWSKNLRHLLGAPEDLKELVEESMINHILEKDHKNINNLLKNAIEFGTNFDLEIQMKTANGLRWMRLIGLSDYENGSCKLLHGLVQDIHEFKSAQLSVLLREEEFRQTFWYAPIGMAVLDLEGKILRINPTMCDTFGFTEKEMLALDTKLISHAEDAIITANLVKQLLTEKSERFQQERRYYHKNKKLIWGILSMSAVKNDKGVITHFVMLVNDITDKKLLTENLTEHNNRLLNYAHIVSHNLRSHTGNLTMLLELSEIDDQQRIDQELFDHIKAASANMSETVSHLSEIVEIQNLIQNTLAPQNLSKRVKKALENVQASINQIHGKVSISVKDNLMVHAIPSYLDSIILNILTNAIKYRSNERPLTIKIVAKNKNGRTSLSITDNGLGIDLERYSSKIFGMYKTFHDHKDARGVGLFMSKNQMEAMGGGIQVQSKQDVGSTFKIFFKDENN